MKRLHFVLGVSAALAAAGCGDNSRQCGDGTSDVNGVCTGTGTASCGEGTILDLNTNTCVIDPNACQDGTVLVGTKCVDPGAVTPDIEEAVEPNGLGLLGEDSATEAGDIILPAVGGTFVIHGRIEPFQDVHGSLVSGDPAPDGQQDVDADTYLLDVTEPTLITVSVDGLHGLSGGFLSVSGGPDPTLAASWQRFGLNLSGDTSKRQLYLPAAGTYALSVTDSRTLLTGEAVEPVSGGLPLDYYVSITTETIAPTALTLTGNVATATGTLASGEVKLFTIAPGLGFNIATLDTPAAQITGSVVVANTRGTALQVKGVADEQDPDPALVSALGFKTGDVTTIVADHVENVANEPIDFTLTVTQSPNAPLSTTGGDAVAGNEPDPNGFTTFFYDVTAANEIDGIDISFDTEVGALVFDENGNLFSLMSADPFFGEIDGMFNYVGHLRHPAPGRYYFAVFDFNNADSTADITATSTITTVTPTTITEGSATGATAVTPFGSKIFTYARGNDPWQQFRSAIAGGGTVQIRLFDPATAFGKLDDLSTDFGDCDPFDTDAQVGDCDDAFPFAFENSAVNNAKLGRILLDDPTNWLVVINKSNDAGTFNSTIEVRDNMADIGTKVAGDTDTKTNQTLSAAITVQRYIVRTDRDNEVQVDLNPNGVTLDVTLDQVDFDESSLGTINAAGINGNETGTFVQSARGWTAWTVTSTLPLAIAETFNQTMTINPAAFTVAASATAFDDACVGGTTQTLTATGSFPANDDGLTGNISSPTDFTFFGTASPTFKVSSNGWLTFDTATTTSAAGNSDLPNAGAPNAVVAPYWDDLEQIVVCTKVSGTKLIVQWVGQTFSDGTKVQTQAILDGADNTIEFVWGPNQAALGDSATIGVENAAGDRSKSIGVNEAGAITAASSKKLTPSP